MRHPPVSRREFIATGSTLVAAACLPSWAEALQSDPVAGLDDDIKTLLIIFLIVAIVILVLQAVD